MTINNLLPSTCEKFNRNCYWTLQIINFTIQSVRKQKIKIWHLKPWHNWFSKVSYPLPRQPIIRTNPFLRRKNFVILSIATLDIVTVIIATIAMTAVEIDPEKCIFDYPDQDAWQYIICTADAYFFLSVFSSRHLLFMLSLLYVHDNTIFVASTLSVLLCVFLFIFFIWFFYW